MEGLGQALGEYRDDIDERFRSRDQKAAMILKGMDARITNAKETAVAAMRSGKSKFDGYDPAGLIKLLATACKAKIARQSVDEFLSANPDPVAGRFRTLIAEGKAMMFKAAVNPAMSSVSGWASELVGPKTVAPLASIAVSSAYGQLSARQSVLPLSFDGTNSIILPARSSGDLAGGFHGEGAPLQVRRTTLTSAPIQPFNFGSISTMTREMSRSPNFEQTLRTEIAADSTVAIDTVFLGDDAGTTIQPPGLLYGVTPITASTATSKIEAAGEDLGALASAIPNAGDLVYISTPEVRARALIYGGPGIASLSWISSPAAPADSVVALDASALAMVESGFAFDISEDAVIHEEDTSPLPISTGSSGASAVTAAPVRSLFQTAVIGIRLLALVSWRLRGSGRVAVVNGIAW